MNTAVINFKTDPKIKAKAQKKAGKLGTNLSDILNNSLKKFVNSDDSEQKTSFGVFSKMTISEKEINDIIHSWDKVLDEI